MAEGKNKSPFSIYWIYALIGIAIIAFQLFMSGAGTATINTKQTFFTLVEKKGVEKVKIINRERVEFHVNQTGKQIVMNGTSSDFQIMKKALNTTSPSKDKKVTFELEEIGDLGNFENEIKTRDPSLSYEAVKETDWLGQIIGFLLPIIILIAIWMFVMRRMSGGSGGGGGGSQIFNIGKSR
ncbi:MAG: ATP-dependent metallopeptidase FtsH/Yme1/Tma family protein, partial [Bacteroidota bacterium]